MRSRSPSTMLYLSLSSSPCCIDRYASCENVSDISDRLDICFSSRDLFSFTRFLIRQHTLSFHLPPSLSAALLNGNGGLISIARDNTRWVDKTRRLGTNLMFQSLGHGLEKHDDMDGQNEVGHLYSMGRDFSRFIALWLVRIHNSIPVYRLRAICEVWATD